MQIQTQTHNIEIEIDLLISENSKSVLFGNAMSHNNKIEITEFITDQLENYSKSQNEICIAIDVQIEECGEEKIRKVFLKNEKSKLEIAQYMHEELMEYIFWDFDETH